MFLSTHNTENIVSADSQHREHCFCRLTTPRTLFLSTHNTENIVSADSQPREHCFFRLTTPRTLFLSTHNPENIVSADSQPREHCFCRLTTPRTLFLSTHNTENIVSADSQPREHCFFRLTTARTLFLPTHNTENIVSVDSQPREHCFCRLTTPRTLFLPTHNPENIVSADSQYRTISILPCFSKNLERLTYNRLNHFPNQSQIITEDQYGLRKYSTYMALINLIDKISSGTDSNTFNTGIFIDLSKAFDTIDHNILFQKLNCYVIRGHTLTWFRSYLEHRTQCVTYNNVN